ncbi:MAG: phytanoyl-CoA dioxygenase [Alphaproteobacteria bacterium]|nr:phytanoyl-CoA dioxygenase [Alphaproteobacteria bacterium]
MKALSEAQVAQYHRDGFLSPLTAMRPAEADAIYRQVAAFEAAHPAEARQAFASKCHLLHPYLYDLCRHPKLLDAVEDIIGPDILCWGSGFFSKRARDGAFVSWHQDSTYWGLEPLDIISVWLAVTPSRRENGCMRVIPGTHQAGQLPHGDTFAAANLLSRGQEIQVQVDAAKAVDLELEPGQFSLHHVAIVHGSEPNNSDLPRYGFVIRYIPTHVRQLGGRTTALLARGQDAYGHFDPEPRPAAYAAAAIAFHKEAIARVESILYSGAAGAGKRQTQAAE